MEITVWTFLWTINFQYLHPIAKLSSKNNHSNWYLLLWHESLWISNLAMYKNYIYTLMTTLSFVYVYSVCCWIFNVPILNMPVLKFNGLGKTESGRDGFLFELNIWLVSGKAMETGSGMINEGPKWYSFCSEGSTFKFCVFRIGLTI